MQGMGFSHETGCDAALRHDNMLAVGLAMQEEYDECF